MEFSRVIPKNIPMLKKLIFLALAPIILAVVLSGFLVIGAVGLWASHGFERVSQGKQFSVEPAKRPPTGLSVTMLRWLTERPKQRGVFLSPKGRFGLGGKRRFATVGLDRDRTPLVGVSKY